MTSSAEACGWVGGWSPVTEQSVCKDRTMLAAASFAIGLLLHSSGARQVRSRRVSCCTTSTIDAEGSTDCWLRNGTRNGYGVCASLGCVPASVADGTPLPEVLVAMDSERFPSMSRARKALRRGTVLINGREGRCITTAAVGDEVELQARIAPGFTPRGRPPFPVEVVYEDDALAVVLKPAGVCTHPPPGGTQGGSMRTAIMHALRPPPVGSAGALYRPHCVHRLDRPTSGLLLCAKRKDTLVALQRSFRERTVAKRYEAIVAGFVEGDDGYIDHPIDERPAQTRWHVVHRCRSLKLGGTHVTHLSLEPRTGRTHQVRAVVGRSARASRTRRMCSR